MTDDGTSEGAAGEGTADEEAFGEGTAGDEGAELRARQCENGHLQYPGHGRCPVCGQPQTERVDVSEWTGEVLTWTESSVTPPGVRDPNTLAIVELSAGEQAVQVFGQTTEAVEIGDAVEAVYVAELRDPDAGIRDSSSQSWDGYRFRPVE